MLAALGDEFSAASQVTGDDGLFLFDGIEFYDTTYLEYRENLIITCFGYSGMGRVRETLSYLSLLKDRVYFLECGYFDPVAIMLGGDMAKQRVADMLPIGFVTQ
jgi:hypothetical protein